VKSNTYAPLLNVMMNTARLAIFVKETYVVERKDVITTICVKIKLVSLSKIAIEFIRFSSKRKEEKGVYHLKKVKNMSQILGLTKTREIDSIKERNNRNNNRIFSNNICSSMEICLNTKRNNKWNKFSRKLYLKKDNFANGDCLYGVKKQKERDNVKSNTYAPLLNVMMNTARLAIFVKET